MAHTCRHDLFVLVSRKGRVDPEGAVLLNGTTGGAQAVGRSSKMPKARMGWFPRHIAGRPGHPSHRPRTSGAARKARRLFSLRQSRGGGWRARFQQGSSSWVARFVWRSPAGSSEWPHPGVALPSGLGRKQFSWDKEEEQSLSCAPRQGPFLLALAWEPRSTADSSIIEVLYNQYRIIRIEVFCGTRGQSWIECRWSLARIWGGAFMARRRLESGEKTEKESLCLLAS